MNLLLLLTSLSIFGTAIIVTPSTMIKNDCDLKDIKYDIGGCYVYDKNVIILNGDYSTEWSRIIPHEFSHMYSFKKKMQTQVKLYFKDDENMALEYEKYFWNEKRYSIDEPIRYLFFKDNFPKF